VRVIFVGDRAVRGDERVANPSRKLEIGNESLGLVFGAFVGRHRPIELEKRVASAIVQNAFARSQFVGAPAPESFSRPVTRAAPGQAADAERCAA
jgi:hypothetical protein